MGRRDGRWPRTGETVPTKGSVLRGSMPEEPTRLFVAFRSAGRPELFGARTSGGAREIEPERSPWGDFDPLLGKGGGNIIRCVSVIYTVEVGEINYYST